MKLEKEIYIGNVYYTEYRNGKYDLNFNCIVSNGLSEEEKEIFDKLQEKLKLKLTLEAKEPILDEVERKYLSGVIRPFRDRIRFIEKNNYSTGREFIYIETKDYEGMSMFPFEPNKMYKGMELNKEYTLKELGL